MALSVRFDPSADVAGAYQRAGGRLERAHFPGARHGFAQEASPDTEKCIALVRDFIGGQLAG